MASLESVPKGPSLKPNMYGLGVAMPLLATAAVALRFQVFSYGFALAMLIDAGLGLDGDHTTYDDNGLPQHIERLVFSFKVEWAEQIISVLALGICKISVLLLYRKIFISRGFRLVNAVMLSLVMIWTISFFFANLLDCIPIKANWDSTSFDGCVDIRKLGYAMCISDIILDVLILTMPWGQIWKLQMPLRQKFLVCGIFLLGGFVVGASVARLVFTIKGFNYEADPSYNTTAANYWMLIEACIGIVCACLPTMRPVFSSVHTPLKSLLESLKRKISDSQLRSKHSNPSPQSTIRHASSARSLFAKRSASVDAQDRRTFDTALPPLPVSKQEMV